MKVLIVDDENYKLDQISALASTVAAFTKIETATSLSQAILRVDSNHYDLLILDLSLSAFDMSNADGGGEGVSLGGVDIFRHVQFAGSSQSKVIFITQYSNVGPQESQMTLDQLGLCVRQEFGEQYIGIVHYKYSNHSWRDQLIEMIEKALGGTSDD